MVAGVERMADKSVVDDRLELSYLVAGVESTVDQSVLDDRLRLSWSQVLNARRTKVFWTEDLSCLGRRC